MAKKVENLKKRELVKLEKQLKEKLNRVKKAIKAKTRKPKKIDKKVLKKKVVKKTKVKDFWGIIDKPRKFKKSNRVIPPKIGRDGKPVFSIRKVELGKYRKRSRASTPKIRKYLNVKHRPCVGIKRY